MSERARRRRRERRAGRGTDPLALGVLVVVLPAVGGGAMFALAFWEPAAGRGVPEVLLNIAAAALLGVVAAAVARQAGASRQGALGWALVAAVLAGACFLLASIVYLAVGCDGGCLD